MRRSFERVLCVVILVVAFALGLMSVRDAFDNDEPLSLASMGSTEVEDLLNSHLPVRDALLVPSYATDAVLDKHYFFEVGLYRIYRTADENLLMAGTGHVRGDPVVGTQRLWQYCEQHGVRFLYVILPGKPESDDELNDLGISCSRNADVDEFLEGATGCGIPVMDLRPLYRDGDFYRWFYRTDYHWTAEAGLYAAGAIASGLNDRYGCGLDVAVLDPGRYETTVYEDFFVGEMAGKTLGPFCDIDDFRVVVPTFETHLRYVDPEHGIDRVGGFETMLFDRHISGDRVIGGHTSCYYYYLDGNNSEVEIFNQDVDGGDLLIVKDSFGVVVAPFLSLAFEHTTLWDMRVGTELITYLEDHPEVETVVVMYNISYVPDAAVHDFV